MAANNKLPKGLLYFALGIILVWLGPGFSMGIELAGIVVGLCFFALAIVFVALPKKIDAKYFVMGIALVGIFASVMFIQTALTRETINPVTVMLRLSLALLFVFDIKSTLPIKE